MAEAEACDLTNKSCVPCRGGVPPLKGSDLRAVAQKLPGWSVINEHHIEKTFTFPDFAKALAFVNRLGAVAEHEGHHPDIFLAWGKVKIELFTHKIDGLTESDFILAAKADAVVSG